MFCGPIIDLAPAVHPGVTAIVDSLESAQTTVDEIAAAGAWGIKIYAQIRARFDGGDHHPRS